jgi:hypothetical protein
MAPRNDHRRRELVEAAPQMPDRFPEPKHGRFRLIDAVFPICQWLYDNSKDFVAWASSINKANSPNGRVCFDDHSMAQAVREHNLKNGSNSMIEKADDGALSTAIKRAMNRVDLGRSKRIAQAKNNLLTARSQPAE